MLKFLHVNCTFFLKSFSYRRFIKLLSASQLFNDASFFKFSLKLLQRFFNVFAGTPLLSGTTGYSTEQMGRIRALAVYAPVLHSGNYSIGIAVFQRVLQQIAPTLMPDFDVEITETHHNQKVDAPSGTALMLRDAVDPRGEMTTVYGRQGAVGKRGAKEIGMHSRRGGTVAGVHTVSFYGPDEEFEITHRAASRQIFVNGALHMARILKDKPNGLYDLQALLFQN